MSLLFCWYRSHNLCILIFCNIPIVIALDSTPFYLMLFVIIGHIFNLNQDLSHKNTEMQTIGRDNYHFFLLMADLLKNLYGVLKRFFDVCISN